MKKSRYMIIRHSLLKSFSIILFAAFAVIIHSCVPAKDNTVKGDPEQDFSNDLVRQIYRLQNQQNYDSLAYFIKSDNPQARFCATRAFGSFQTPKAVSLIKERLQDSIFEIKAEAAYVAGQLRDTSLIDPLLAAFEANEKREVNHLLNRNVLEAIGKIGNDIQLNFLASSKAYPKKYDLLNAGKAHAYYQYALRGKTNDKATAEMVKFVTEDYPGEAGLMAANYLLRAKDISIEQYKFQILQGMLKSEDPNIRMCLSAALGKSGSADILSPYMDFLKKEKDSRVVINGIRSLNNFEYIQVIDNVLSFLSHKDQNVALAAASWLGSNGKTADYRFYLEFVEKVNDPKVKRAIQGAVLKLVGQYYGNTRGRIVRSLTEEFNDSSDPYERADIINVIGQNPYLYQTIHDLGFKDSALVVKSTSVENLGAIITQFLPSQSNAQKRYLSRLVAPMMTEALKSGDVGMIAAAADALSASDPQMMGALIEREVLDSCIMKLQMPQHIEPINNCIKAINNLYPDANMALKSSDRLREFDMQGIDVLGKDAIAVIVTDKGDIRIKLYAHHAPATVMNFVDLAQQNYYSGKLFHRVVPNFVIQAGCPRGDGYGSEDYIIRSELSPKYYDDGGYIGMASAGNHTESTQWFITHSPTPHLNGRYTIFGKVEGGMDVVQQIQVGDKIQSINIINDLAKAPVQ